MAFRLFHGRDGVVPLSERSFVHREAAEPELAPPRFNPLTAKAATISLSSFGPGGPFSFDSFSKKWKNQKRKSKSSKKESSSQVQLYPFSDLSSLILNLKILVIFFLEG